MPILQRAPQFDLVVSKTGAIAAETGAINDTNYPPYNAWNKPQQSKRLVLYWTATGAADLDSIDIQVLARDTTTGAWVKSQYLSNVPPNKQIAVHLGDTTMGHFRIPVVAISSGAAALKIYAAIG